MSCVVRFIGEHNNIQFSSQAHVDALPLHRSDKDHGTHKKEPTQLRFDKLPSEMCLSDGGGTNVVREIEIEIIYDDR